MTIVSIRGTHGSGKSTIVKTILDKYPSEPFSRVQSSNGQERLRGYNVSLPTGKTLVVVGAYKTACGGCDGIQPYADIWPIVDSAAVIGHDVLFEGALVSSSYGEIGRASEEYGDQMVFAFLDTPLELCLKRIADRRAAKLNFEPVNPRNTTVKFDNVMRSRSKISAEFGRRCVIIDHTKPVQQVLKLFGVNLRKEPR